MKHVVLVCLCGLGAALWACFSLGSEGENTYAGLTASQWESELRHWSLTASGCTNKSGRRTSWIREAPWWQSWLGILGLSPPQTARGLPLLEGDPMAVHVLAELLGAEDREARLIAVEGLDRIGKRAGPAVPALLTALHDEDYEVQMAAAWALFSVDREAARTAGLRWKKGVGTTWPDGKEVGWMMFP
jgi:HEAT repeats